MEAIDLCRLSVPVEEGEGLSPPVGSSLGPWGPPRPLLSLQMGCIQGAAFPLQVSTALSRAA